ncbi:MAG: hypothetical protein JJ896_03410 [Rhodothermales bacterium]|nr:hypothetical protein [Rhodothermales bacterium]MBO6778682.1 hypothetical protein [Rhodothermales bacterium]
MSSGRPAEDWNVSIYFEGGVPTWSMQVKAGRSGASIVARTWNEVLGDVVRTIDGSDPRTLAGFLASEAAFLSGFAVGGAAYGRCEGLPEHLGTLMLLAANHDPDLPGRELAMQLLGLPAGADLPAIVSALDPLEKGVMSTEGGRKSWLLSRLAEQRGESVTSFLESVPTGELKVFLNPPAL